MSTLDEDGCLWICIDPRCPELRAGELEAADLDEAGVPASWGTGSYVEDQALASLHAELFEMGRLAETTAASAALCATVGRTVADAASRLHGIDPELHGLMPFDQG